MERNPSLVFPELFDLPSRNSNGRANIFAISSSPNRPIHRFRSLIEATFGLFINAELFRVNYSGSTLSDYWTINNFEYFASKQCHEWTGLERDKNRLLPDQLFLLLSSSVFDHDERPTVRRLERNEEEKILQNLRVNRRIAPSSFALIS